eukprot:564171_1
MQTVHNHPHPLVTTDKIQTTYHSNSIITAHMFNNINQYKAFQSVDDALSFYTKQLKELELQENANNNGRIVCTGSGTNTNTYNIHFHDDFNEQNPCTNTSHDCADNDQDSDIDESLVTAKPKRHKPNNYQPKHAQYIVFKKDNKLIGKKRSFSQM